MRIRLVACIIAGLICFVTVPASAQFAIGVDGLAKKASAKNPDVPVNTNRCVAQPIVDDYVPYCYDSLSDFLGSFVVVDEKGTESNQSGFRVRRRGLKDVYRWTIDCSLVPEEVNVRHTFRKDRFGQKIISKTSYEILLASSWVSLKYFGSATQSTTKDGVQYDPKVMLYIRVRADDFGFYVLNADQLQLLVNSVKTQQPVHLKGKMIFDLTAKDAYELQTKLDQRKGIEITILEINGVPVPGSDLSYSEDE